MSDFYVEEIKATDTIANLSLNKLLSSSEIRMDKNIDYTCGIFDDNKNVIATGSCFKNTLRCFAVDSSYRGEGLLNTILTHLLNYQYEKGNFHLFLYTKIKSAKFFEDSGFYKIASGKDLVVFMENKRTGFKDFISNLKKETLSKIKGDMCPKSCAIVMNANPFTLGHQYLVEKAALENEWVHLFVVSEEESLVPFNIRKRLVIEGTSHLKNIIVHDCSSYIISNATFPSYFQKNEEDVINSHVELDLTIFAKIAQELNISSRYVGDEPLSFVTNKYNQCMKATLPEYNINCVIVSRKKITDKAISASTVRMAIKNEDYTLLETLVPKSTLDFFKSDEALSIIKRIKSSEESQIIHY